MKVNNINFSLAPDVKDIKTFEDLDFWMDMVSLSQEFEDEEVFEKEVTFTSLGLKRCNPDKK